MPADFITSLTAVLKREPGSISRDMLLADLGVDSFDLVDLLVRLQEDLGVRVFQEDLAGVKSVGDLENAFAKRRPA